MTRRKAVLFVLGLVSVLSVAAVAQVPEWISVYTSPFGGEAAHVSFNNLTGDTANVLHLEFDQEVTVTYYLAVGGMPMLAGEATGTSMDFVGCMINYSELYVVWEPITAFPVYAQWLVGERPTGTPFVGSIAVLGRLFGQGIAHAREADPAGLLAAFDQFFADNVEYLAGLSASLGMSLADSLMPVILDAPAEGIENFFNTIVGMLGVASLEEVIGGEMNFSALFAFLGF